MILEMENKANVLKQVIGPAVMALAQMAHHQECQRALGSTGVIQPLVRLCFTNQSPAVLSQVQDQCPRGVGNYAGMGDADWCE